MHGLSSRGLVCWLLSGLAVVVAADEERAGTAVLDTGSFWRVRTVWETVEVVRSSGEIEHARFVYDHNWFRENEGKLEVERGQYEVEPIPVVRLPEQTPTDWMSPEFDDSTWCVCAARYSPIRRMSTGSSF
jgi:hypothetical protein